MTKKSKTIYVTMYDYHITNIYSTFELALQSLKDEYEDETSWKYLEDWIEEIEIDTNKTIRKWTIKELKKM